MEQVGDDVAEVRETAHPNRECGECSDRRDQAPDHRQPRGDQGHEQAQRDDDQQDEQRRLGREEGLRSREQHLHDVRLDLEPGHAGRYALGLRGADAGRRQVLVLDPGQVVAPDQDDLAAERLCGHAAFDQVGERVVLVAELVGAGTTGVADDRLRPAPGWSRPELNSERTR